MRRRLILIPTASMSDIAFLLLIFLMVTSLTSSEKAAKVTVPQIVRAEKIDVRKRINVFIEKNGDIYLEDLKLDASSLQEALYSRTAFRQDPVIFIHADRDASCAVLDGLLTALKKGGLRNCVFVAKKVSVPAGG